MIVGLTGGIGAGKSTVLKMFAELGVPVNSSDEIARNIVDNDPAVLQQIVSKFGQDFLLPDGKLDRKKLRHKIFNDPADKKWLESLLHPLIREQYTKFAQQVNYPYCVIELPLLFEANMHKNVERVLTVDCAEDIQIKRTMVRDAIAAPDTLNILNSQISRQERLAQSDDILDNSADLATLKQAVAALHAKYLANVL